MEATASASPSSSSSLPPAIIAPTTTEGKEGKMEMKETSAAAVTGGGSSSTTKAPAATPGAGEMTAAPAAAVSGNGSAGAKKGGKKKGKNGNGAAATPSSSSAESSPAVSPTPESVEAVQTTATNGGSTSSNGDGTGGPSAATLVGWAQRLVAHDMGLKDAALLDESFFFLGPFDGPIDKEPFLEGSKKFDLRGAFPDFDFQAHDFRVDGAEPLRVWFTTRKAGTHKGPLPMYGQTIKPTLKTLDFPPEAYSATFNAEGKCVKLTGGFVMDATQGNSHGLGGPYGIAAAVGKPLSTFKHQPPIPALLSILKPRIASLPLIGARVCPKPTATPAPLPSSTSLSKAELLALAKAYVEKKGAGAGGEEEALLAPDFMHYDPLDGWTNREAYVASMKANDLRAAFPDLEVKTYNFRVDPYAPATVWFTQRSTGTHTGAGLGSGRLAIPPATNRRYESPPEEVSLTFADHSRQLIRMTAGAVLDRGQGNTGGLGGLHGVFYALGRPSLPALTRPILSHSVGEWKTALLQTCATPVVAQVPILRKAAKLARVLPFLDMDAQEHCETTTVAEAEEEKQQEG